MVRKSYDELLSNTIKRQRDKYDFKSVEDIKNMNYPLDKELLYISYLREYFVNVEELGKYLRYKFESDNNILEKTLMDGKAKSIRTNLRRLIRIYDYLLGKKDKYKATSNKLRASNLSLPTSMIYPIALNA